MNLYEKIGDEKIDELVMHMYDDIIPNDDRINILFNDGFEKIKVEQKKFFRLFLGEPGHSVFATPDLRKKHMKLPISIKEAKYWLEDFEFALDRYRPGNKEICESKNQFINNANDKYNLNYLRYPLYWIFYIFDKAGNYYYATTSSSSDLEKISLSASGEEAETNLIEDFILKRNASSLCTLLAVNAPWILVNNHSLTGLQTSSGKFLSNKPSASNKRQFSSISLHFSAIIGESSAVSIANNVSEKPLRLHALPFDIKRSKTVVKYSSKVPNLGEIVLNSFFTLQFILSNASR